MLLPTKGISAQRALLSVGASILDELDSPATVSGLWERFSKRDAGQRDAQTITFDWFTLALTMLFTIGVVDWDSGDRLERINAVA